jgi:hypothetical protein
MNCRRAVRRPSRSPRGELVPFEEQDARKLDAQIASLTINIARLRAAGDSEAAEPLAEEACRLRAKASDLRLRLRQRREEKS